MSLGIRDIDIEKFDGSHEFLSEELLTPNVDKAD
jgi:hypothetical protein